MSDSNGILMQAFHAHIPDLDQHLQHLQNEAKVLAEAGFTALWLPSLTTLAVLSRSGSDSALAAQYEQTVSALRAAGLQIYTDLGRDLSSNLDMESPDSPHWPSADGFCVDAETRPHLAQTLLRAQVEPVPFVMSEYWSEQVEDLHQYISATNRVTHSTTNSATNSAVRRQLSLLDVPLHCNFYRASRSGGYYDMSKLLDGTLMQQQPALAVTFVESHCSQPLSVARPESTVEPWFKPLAYAIILLRREGYPCLFYPDYYGAHYYAQGSDGKEHEIWLNSHRWLLDKFLYARQHYAHGAQTDYFEQPCVVGWTRSGTAAHPKSMAVLMSDGWGGSQWMALGRPNAAYFDLTGHIQGIVHTNAAGWGEFYCRSGSVSVWLEE